jgi:uncharacterized protein
MEITGYILAVLIGLSLGLIGGGGSILTVPVLVYFMGVDPLLATTYSLFIVGFTSLAGGIKAYTRKLVDFRSISLFGIPSILAIFIARHFILPIIPEHIVTIGHLHISKGRLLMMVFALLMLTAAISMMIKRHHGDNGAPVDAPRTDTTLPLLLPGVVVGLVTGLLGAGGGFLIIPALVLLIKLPIKTAIGTSLLIIAINSTFGFVFSIGHFSFDWQLLGIFTLLAIVGVFIGGRISERLDGSTLRKGFGWFVLAMSIYILSKELFFPLFQ